MSISSFGLTAALLMAEISKGFSAAIIFGLVGLACAVGMAIAISKAVESISRQPSAENKIRGALMVGLAFIETIAIYGLLIAILVLVL